MSFIDTIKYKYKTGSIIDKLIYINIAVFAISLLITVISGLYKVNQNFLMDWFSLDDNVNEFLSKPWSIISYGFLHAGFIHLIFNMITLYFMGNFFIQYFTQKQALQFYILGTLFGGLFFILSQNYFPLFEDESYSLVGASAGISAIILGITTYMPNYQVKIPLIGYVKLWHLTAIWLGLDIVGLIGPNAGGSFSHLGGSLFGFLYVNNASNKKIDFFGNFSKYFQKKEKPLKTVYKSAKKTTEKSKKTSYNQEQIDTILDKISKSGYDTLTKSEKEFLFKQGKK
ncbi:rhomboid family intramembrane serine protease [Polaribacter aestuariivivens]|uniref:Rhomboid family intramembrane serine protease n=1 Tax=Polaribacter aestuariivivens TaxID=2304626 RepID=A0A5S3N7M9_9FLAO|nr:rhomboid family intramembrane serine protease [Polaribacter aestuariivivens]TMM31398.1 rhomboid family intramembrane serine protease [Polaribacter aestuariivivens]